jgi:hypothetical protein
MHERLPQQGEHKSGTGDREIRMYTSAWVVELVQLLLVQAAGSAVPARNTCLPLCYCVFAWLLQHMHEEVG